MHVIIHVLALSSFIKPTTEVIDHMTDVLETDQQKLVNLQQRTRNTALVFTAHPQLHGFS